MPINFTQIIKDSWNFIQNEKRIVAMLIGLYAVAMLFVTLLESSLLPNFNMTIMLDENGLPKNIPDELASNIITFFFAKQFIYVFVGAWCLVTIHQVSQRNIGSPLHGFAVALKRIWGVIFINVLIFIPIMIGLTESFIAVQQKVQPSMLSLFAMIAGIILYVRLCLSAVHYLLTANSIIASWQTVWRAGRGRTSLLFIFCLLIYIVLPMAEGFFLRFSVNAFMAVIMALFVAFINVFALIITYRFYTLFVTKA